MKLKELFKVPEGKKITEKCLYRVLISYVCSILLCMSCLAGTTWAWFTVDVENTGNVIEIGTATVVVDTAGGATVFDSGKIMEHGTYSLRVWNSNTADDFNKKATLYVTFFVDEQVQGYTILGPSEDEHNHYQSYITLNLGKDSKVSWTASWIQPNANPLDHDTITVGTYTEPVTGTDYNEAEERKCA